MLFIFERRRHTECKWERARERETENLKQAPGSQLTVQDPTQSSNPKNHEIMT